MRKNTPNTFDEKTHEGAPAARMTAEQALRRSVLSCMLWEREFYESGEDIAARILRLCGEVKASVIGELAIEAREKFKLRHVPLLLLTALVRAGDRTGDVGRGYISETIARVIQRPDEMGELLALYWNGKKTPVAKQLQKGLAKAFPKFDAYQLAKYDRDAAVKLKDVLFIAHPKAPNPALQETWNALVRGELEAPETWEVMLSGGADKREVFTDLLMRKKLGYLALLRNLRNMAQAGVDENLINVALTERRGADRVLPFRYTAAARAAPQFEPALDQALSESIAQLQVLSGKTVVLVDVSRSMDAKLSMKSDLTRLDAAATLASIIPGSVRMFSFSEGIVEVPPRRGMAGIDALARSQPHQGTHLFEAVAWINFNVPYDRLIVITDEQTTGNVNFHMIQGGLRALPDPHALGYMINVASAKNGVGYGPWVHIDGFSEAVLNFIGEHERSAA